MKIMMIIDNLMVGGMQRRFIELLKGLKSFTDLQCLVVILNDNIYFTQVFDLGYETVVLQRKLKKDLKVACRLNRLCKIHKPDIVHAWGSMSAIYSVMLKILFKLKFINAMISNAPEKVPFKNRIRMKLTQPFSDLIVANSLAGLHSYKISGKKAKFIHNGVDLKRFDNPQDSGKISCQSHRNKSIIGMTGSFDTRKDYSTFISAALIILKKRIDVEFWAIGDGPLLEKIESEAGEFLQKGIYFPGRISNIEDVIRSIKIGVLSTYTEGISNSIIEFMALSKPVVATDGGGTKELIIDGITGFLINKGDFKELAAKIELLLDSPELSKSMGMEARKRIENEFNIEKMTNSYRELYYSLFQ